MSQRNLWKFVVPIVLIVSLLFVGMAFAQESTAEFPTPTAEATVEPTAEPTPAPELEPIAGVPAVTVWPVIAFLSLVVVGIFEAVRSRQSAKLVDRLVEVLERRDFQDSVEREYAKSSMSVKDFVSLLRSGLVVVGNANIPVIDPVVDKGVEFIDKVSDGQPN